MTPFAVVRLAYVLAVLCTVIAFIVAFARGRGRRGSGIWNPRHWFALVAIAIGVVFLQVGCSPNAPTPVPSPGPTSVVNITVPGNGNVIIPGNGNVINTPGPNASPSPGGDNEVTSFPIFCYGFGAVPPQLEPNHDKCSLPVGYPNIAVTASPKNKAGKDIPNPGDKTDEKVIDWAFSVAPSNAATLTIQADNRFNARVDPASPRVSGAVFTLTATYLDPQGNIRIATKSGAIE